MSGDLLQTKLYVPRLRPFLVSRPSLIEKLNRGLHHKLTIISAPAGFGKTTLIASHIVGSDHPVAWLSLDKDDNLETRFLHYLIAALQETNQTIGIEAAQLLTAEQAPSQAILTSLLNDIARTDREISLVLDDYHFIKNQSVHAAVAFLLDHCPEICHLVIATRSDPPLPLARLRARNQMVEIRAADLCFTESETTQFLNDIMGLHVDARSVTTLTSRTEGWIAGLQMVALSLQDRESVSEFIEGFSGTNRHILDYLLEEVLAREPEEVQTFLLQTAILKRLSGSFCDAVTGASGGQDMLEKLERHNLFVVPLDDDRRWYRYHHLFADLLQARLHRAGDEQVARLFSRAVDWCEHNGQVVEAVDYALSAQDFERASDLILRYWGEVTSKGEIETVWVWLNALPEVTIRNSAPLSVVTCWLLWFSGKIDLIEERLADAERALSLHVVNEPEPDDAFYVLLPVQIATLHAFVARYRNQFETAKNQAEQAFNMITENVPSQANAQLHSMIFLALASACDGAGDLERAVTAYTETIRWSRLSMNAAGVTGITYRLVGALRLLGRLRAADKACRDGLTYIQEKGMARLPATGILHLALSEVLVEQNDLEAAEAHLAQGIDLGKWSGRLDPAKNAVFAMARLRLVSGDVDGALTAVIDAESSLSQPPSPLALAELLALKAKILICQGSLTSAAQAAEQAVQLAGDDRGQTGQMAELAACRVLLAQGKHDDLNAQLIQALTAAEENGRFGVALELYILRSLMCVQQGKLQEAESDLACALKLAEPEGYLRLFLDEGQPMQLLLTQWLAHADIDPLWDYAHRLHSQFEAAPQIMTTSQEKVVPVSSLIEPLSQRELEVLAIMAQGKTNKEIAQQLVIAPGTVKAHTASIYRKLDVANRTEAGARARELGILT